MFGFCTQQGNPSLFLISMVVYSFKETGKCKEKGLQIAYVRDMLTTLNDTE